LFHKGSMGGQMMVWNVMLWILLKPHL